MKEFGILRYLNRARYLILILMLVGAYGVYRYAVSNQSYSGSTVIRYDSMDQETGLTPQGEKIVPQDVYCSTVVSAALESLGYSNTMEYIRARFSVNEVLSSEEQTRKATLIDEGKEYTRISNKYLISYWMDGSGNAETVRNIMDAVLSAYFQYYSEKYVNTQIIPNNVGNALIDRYEYIENVEIIESSLREIVEFLDTKEAYNAAFRSTVTGYSFGDLREKYAFMLDNTVPRLYAGVLGGKHARDTELLLSKYQNRIDDNERKINALQKNMDELATLIAQYSTKNADSLAYNTTNQGQTADVLGQIYTASEAETTTYDKLIGEYIALDTELRTTKVNSEYLRSIYDTYAGTDGEPDETASTQVTAMLNAAADRMNELYDLLTGTLNDFNAYEGAKGITMLNNVSVSEGLNVKLYVVMAAVLFLFIGCVGTIVVSRIVEYIDYFLFYDQNMALPNRLRCNNEIDKLSRKRIEPDFSVVLIRLNSLSAVNTNYGHARGNEHMNDFAGLLKICAPQDGFIAFNGGNQFIGLVGGWNEEKEALFEAMLSEHVDLYNQEHPQAVPMAVSVSCVIAQRDKCFEIRAMITLAFKRLA